MTRLGIIGCGAVARCYYAPAIKRVAATGKLKLVGVFDPDPQAAAEFLASFPDAAATVSFEALLGLELDHLIIASPPPFHREQAIAALRRGIPVHCEKPLATTLRDGLAMIAESERTKTRLSVNMVRRHLAPARSVGSMLQSGSIGELRSIAIFEGGPFRWPVQSSAYFDPAAGGVGVLEDLGTHVLDLLCSWLGTPQSLAYSDDAIGGIAANCLIEAGFGSSKAHIRLSRDWYRPNCWTFLGDGGTIVWNRDDENVQVRLGPICPNVIEPGPGSRLTFEEAFAAPIEAMASGAPDDVYVLATDVLPALEAVEACKAVRKRMAMPWLS